MNASTRAREAALLVHSLSDAARVQVLTRLSTEERTQVEPLLAELASLGIPRLPYDEGRASPALSESPTLIEQVARLQPAQVLHGLRNCCAGTTAQVLCITEWPWKASVLTNMDSSRRKVIVALGEASARPPARRVAEILCSKLLTDAQDVAPPAANARPRNGLRRWFAWKQ